MKPEPIDDHKLDELLRDLYLEENAAQENAAEADFVFSQVNDVAIDKTKEQELLRRLNKGRGYMKWIWLALFVVLVLIALYFMMKEKDKTQPHNKTQQEAIVTTPGGSEEQKVLLSESAPISFRIKDTFGKPKVYKEKLTDTAQVQSAPTQTVHPNPEPTVPFISEKDIQRYKKIKEQMLSCLVRGDKNLYTHVPSEKTRYAGKEIILDAFSLRNVGITNLEYRTFLADLLSENKHTLYFIAQVRNEGWEKNGCPAFASDYFTNEKYNDFPVVNIPLGAAQLFCDWLQEEAMEYIKLHKLKVKELTIRLPYDEEWIFAAREGYAKIAFEKGYNTIYDESEGLVDRSFTKRAELVKKRVKRVDTLYTELTTNHYGWTEKEMQQFFAKGFIYYKEAVADTIYGERMKVLGKIGRVSEMTTQRNNAKLYLSGLSWKSKEDYQKLENEFKRDTYSPFVGFRFVVINPSDPEYKNPFW